MLARVSSKGGLDVEQAFAHHHLALEHGVDLALWFGVAAFLQQVELGQLVTQLGEGHRQASLRLRGRTARNDEGGVQGAV
jgi:hypothetical protein